MGTIRSNLDPLHRRTDQEIWAALDAVHLSENIKQNMPAKLETPIIENGRNFSLGQRQLFCIARAILFQSRILVLDGMPSSNTRLLQLLPRNLVLTPPFPSHLNFAEATSAVDIQTDLLIQETIKRNFANCTVLMIAHRLNTIIECDKILVMEDGKVVEFEHPTKLIENKDGYFHSLVSQSGPEAVARLKIMLREHGQTVDGEPPIVIDRSVPGEKTGVIEEDDEESQESTPPGSQSRQFPGAPSIAVVGPEESLPSGSSSGSLGSGSTAEGSSAPMTGSTNIVASPVATTSSTTHQMPRSLEDVFAPRS